MDYRGMRLDRFQQQAIEAIEAGHSVLVAAPTGTGKTLIADYLIEHILKDGGEIVYTAPVKALSNQKYRQYCALYGRDKVGLVTGDLVINRDAPVRVMTTEILRNILLEGHVRPTMPELEGTGQSASPGGVAREEVAREKAHIQALERQEWQQTSVGADVAIPQLGKLRAVIVDEIHFLDDPERGTVWEELLIYLPSDIRILGLSATLSNLEEFAAWLSHIRHSEVVVVREDRRAVPLELRLASNATGVVAIEQYNKSYARAKKDARKDDRDQRKQGPDKAGRGPRGRGRGRGERREAPEENQATQHSDVIAMLHPQSFPALYFIYSRKLVEVLATRLAYAREARNLASGLDRVALEKRLDAFDKQHPRVLSKKLRSMYMAGIAFHHAGLHVALKTLVEELYESRLVNLLYCTSTFAMGINMPARTVIFDSLTKFDGQEIVPLTVREFMQMAGRAGRRGMDKVGQVVIRQDYGDYGQVQGLLKKLWSNHSEPVQSSFNLSFHSVVNLLARFNEAEIRFMLEQSFKAFQSQRSAGELRELIETKSQEMEVLDEAELTHRQTRQQRRDLSYLQRQLAEEERPRMWEAFLHKVAFLRAHGYLGPANELHVPARILRHVKIEEILVTELVVQGLLEDLAPATLFGVMCGLVQTLPRSARVRPPQQDHWWPLFSRLQAVYESDIVTGAEELSQQSTTFTPELMPLGERWAQGESLAHLLEDIRNPTDLSGDLVGAFRRAKDLIGQLRHVYHADEIRRGELTELLRQVTRDEVEVVD